MRIQHLMVVGLAGMLFATAWVVHCLASATEPGTPQAPVALSITGVISVRIPLLDGHIAAFIHPSRTAPTLSGTLIVASAMMAESLTPNNEVIVTGLNGASPFDEPRQALLATHVVAIDSQQPIPIVSMPSDVGTSGGEMLQAGRYVRFEVVAMDAHDFDGEGRVWVHTKGGLKLQLWGGASLAHERLPVPPVHLEGVPVRAGEELLLRPARILSSQNARMKSLLTQHGCVVCHDTHQRRTGPAFREIANRYFRQSDAVDYLMERMGLGGMGSWGATPMPAFEKDIGPEERRLLAEWVLLLHWESILAN